jgi:outer membrane protein assembly complex protein YaeT
MMPKHFFWILLLTLCPAAQAAGNGVTVASVTLSGNLFIQSAEIADYAALRPGAAWTPDLKLLSTQIISSLYRSRGFMEASVSISELAKGASVFLQLEVREGPRYTFGETSVSGLAKLRPETVKKELTYSAGDPYSQQKLLSSQGQLYATNWFETLGTRVSSATAGVMDVEILTEEKPLKWVKGGVGYGSEEKERFSLGVAHNNFLDRGYKLDLGWTVSRISLEYRADFLNRHFLDSRTELRGSSAWRRELREGYDMESVKNTVSLGRRLLADVYGSVQYRLQRTLTYNVDPSISAETPSLSRIRSAAVSFNRDTTDDFFYPSRGLRSELTLERSGGLWGGDINLYRASLRNTAYHRLFDDVTGLLSARWAFVRETGPTPDVPIYERLFYGGANSVRGYAERGVGPADASGNPLGGKVLLGASAELRFPIYKKLRGALFTDGGQVADSLRGAAPRRWQYGAGAGIRYRTPVGPIRADFGYKLNPDRPISPDLWRLHLSIGEAF